MRNVKVLLAGAAACLAWTASGTVVNVADGDTVVIGTDVASEPSIELVVTTGASGVTLVLPPIDPAVDVGTAFVWPRIYLKGRRRPPSSWPAASRPTTPRPCMWPRRT